ncbi:ABC transporter permease [Corynebacterium pygosceleis]|uniref:FtsX-like permease family protein n=1 Tax=Corynebacterium pygosceleis TaxID=2800406 RepID=A0A9Q4C9G9_9CORY|nr:FtsX-like permease family protein [Corynebacterium pygosceleis]MCK7638194.1 FtsX-like permease family protein [Corynebacterium pygosceleis]MCL0121556.1 FtsX-like permease family protein [Corynebacterium pygosceleis]MCX7469349.1 FtsX-like permease family protein [Corynebacterium pygosceleis]
MSTSTHTGLRKPMRTISRRTIAAHKLRLALTILAVVLGTAFIAGSSMFTASLSSSFAKIIATQYDDVDIVVSGPDGAGRALDADTVREIRERDDLTAADMIVQPAPMILAGSDGKAIQTGGAPSDAIPYNPDQENAGSLTLVDGAWPGDTDEVAVNTSAAERGDITIGDKVTVVTPGDQFEVTVTGTYDVPTATGGWIGVLLPEDQFLDIYAPDNLVNSASLVLADGADLDGVIDDLRATYPDLSVDDADVLVERQTKELKKALSFVNYFLWAFAAIALLVGTFIISNTFAMIVAERTREFALLRSIGASRSQITRSVIGEAVIVGVIGSALGIVLGVALAKGLFFALKTGGIGMPDSGLSLTPSTIIVPLVVGAIVTVLSAWAPARRAGSIHPVEAMRSGDSSSHNSLRARTVIGGLITGVGAALCLFGAFTTSVDEIKYRLISIGVGALAVIIGVWLIGPALSIPVVGGLGRIIGAPFGAVGKLASTNSRRSPRRTAATAFALTLGLMMVSSIGMLGATMRHSIESIVDDVFTSDYVVTAQNSNVFKIPSSVPDRITALDEVEAAHTVYHAPILVNGAPLYPAFGGIPKSPVSNLNLDSGEGLAVTITEGSGNLRDERGVILFRDIADRFNLHVGDTVALSTPAGSGPVEVPLLGTYEEMQAGGPGFISVSAATELLPLNQMDIETVLVDRSDGTSESELGDALRTAMSDYLVVQVMSKDEYASSQANQVDQLLGILYGLLGLAVIIAVLGIINTLALSVTERRREIGMLRALGTQRGQIRRMIYLESVVIALFGALLGAAVGLGLGWCFTRTVGEDSLETVIVPWGQLGIMLVASAVVGVIAAVWPGHRAAKTKPLDAISDR